jgi:hypothetical protein
MFAIYFIIAALWLWSRRARAEVIEPDLTTVPATE